MNKLIAFAVGLFMAVSAHAVTEYRFFFNAATTGTTDMYTPWMTDLTASCLALPDYSHPSYPGQRFYSQQFGAGCRLARESFQWSGIVSPETRDQPVCTSPQVPNPNGSGCIDGPNPCTAKTGIPRTTNFTVGYTRTDGLGSNSDDYSCVGGCNQIPVSKQVCDGSCTVELGSASNAWRSTTPTSQGLYRLSIDFEAVPTGGQCSMTGPTATATNPTTPNPTCPGFVGEINGKPTCVGTASQPITTTQADRSAQGAKPANPPAGEKPASGEGSGSTGSGRTPVAGSGGAAGGPASAAVGPTGTTTVEGGGGPGVDTVEQAACGAPGQPKCLIDETGTPSGVGETFTGAKGELDANKTAAQNAISGAQGISAPTWSFTFELPTGCTPYATGIMGFTMNPCTYQSTIHDLMSMVWAAVTAFCIIGMVGRTIRES